MSNTNEACNSSEAFSPSHTKSALALQAALGFSSIEVTKLVRQTAMVELKEEQELIEAMLCGTGHYKPSFTSLEDNSIVVRYAATDANSIVVHLPASEFGSNAYKVSSLALKRMTENKNHNEVQAPSRTWIKPESILTFHNYW